MAYPNLELDQAQEAWSAHLDACADCEKLVEDFCPRGSDLLGELVAILQEDARTGVDLALLCSAAEAAAEVADYYGEARA
jgi:hypothetical protein